MKNILLLSVSFIIFQGAVFSQSCLPEGITFTTQAQIDSFQVNYPSCSRIEGNVIISGAGIGHLNGLNSLTSIGGNLLIENISFLQSFSGLENIRTIDGDLELSTLYNISGYSGFEGLKKIGGDLNLISNFGVYSFEGFNHLDSIQGSLLVHAGALLDNLSGFEIGRAHV